MKKNIQSIGLFNTLFISYLVLSISSVGYAQEEIIQNLSTEKTVLDSIDTVKQVLPTDESESLLSNEIFTPDIDSVIVSPEEREFLNTSRAKIATKENIHIDVLPDHEGNSIFKPLSTLNDTLAINSSPVDTTLVIEENILEILLKPHSGSDLLQKPVDKESAVIDTIYIHLSPIDSLAIKNVYEDSLRFHLPIEKK